VLQCVAVCCSVACDVRISQRRALQGALEGQGHYSSVRCNTLKLTATHILRTILQHTYIALLCTNTLLCDIRTLQLSAREMQKFFWSTRIYNKKRSDLICRSKFSFLAILGFRSLGSCSWWPEGICRHSTCTFILRV